VTVAALEVLKYKGYVQFPALQWSVAKKVAPLAIVFLGYVVVSLVSLARVNVPMFTALRRLTILFVMVEEYFYFGAWHGRTRLVCAARPPTTHPHHAHAHTNRRRHRAHPRRHQ